MKNRTSSSYRFSFDVNDQAGYEKLESLRKEIAIRNRGGERLRVCVKGRLGENNPAAIIYQERAKRMTSGAYRTIKLEHAGRFDVYVYMR